MKTNDPKLLPYRLGASVCIIGYALCFYTFRPAVGPLSFLLSGVAGAFYFGIFVCLALVSLRRFDEFQRMLLARSFVSAAVVTFAIETIWGFVELGSHRTVPRLPVVLLPIIQLCLTAAAKLLIFRQHRSPHE